MAFLEALKTNQAPWAVLSFLSLFTLAACGGALQTPEEIRSESKDAKAAQIMRVAESTARGGDLTAAAGLFRRASAFAPNDATPLLRLGQTLTAAKTYRDAAQAYRDALALPALSPEDEAAARYGYGRVLIHMNRPKLAVGEFEKVTALKANDAGVLNLLGVALDLTGRHDDAQVRYRDSLKLRADAASVRNNLGLSLALSGKFDEALGILTVLAKDPIAEDRHKLNLALVYGLAGRRDDAAQAAARLLTPDQVANNLARYETLRAMTPEARARAVFGLQ